MKRIILFTVILIGTAAAMAQAPAAIPQVNPTREEVKPKTPYDSTQAQLWNEKLKNAQLQANGMSAQFQAQMAQFRQQFQDNDKKINDWAETVRKANGWDETYTYDRENDKWQHVPIPPLPVKKDEPAKTETPKK